MEQLKVGIGADTKELEKGLKDAEKALKTFADKSSKIETQLKKNALATSKLGAETSKLKSDFDKGVVSQKQYDKQLEELVNEEKRLSAQSKVLRSDLAKLNQSTKDLGGKGFASAKKGAANAVPAVTEFSRVIQDAPFGIQGVANNITQLTQQFGYLTKSTGSSSAALKAMLGTLTGPAGILLVVSAVTSILVSFGDELFRSSDAASKLKDEQDKLTKSLEDYESTLIGVQKTELEGTKTATKELVTLKLLKEQLDDTSLSEQKRLNALKELQKRYPSILGNISNEVALNKGLGKSYDGLVDLINNKAKAEAASQNIIENTRKELVLQSKLESSRLKIKEAYNSLSDKEISDLNTLIKRNISLNTMSKLLNGNAKQLVDLKIDEKKQVEQITKLQRDSLKLANQIKEKGGIVPLDFSSDTPTKVNKKVISLLDLVEYKTEDVSFFADKIEEDFRNAFLPITDELQGSEIDWERMFKQDQLANQIMETEQKLDSFNEGIRSTLERGAENLAIGFGQAIGNALATGGNVLDSLGSALLGSLGSVLTQVGQMAIAIGIGLKAIREALKTLNPFVAIAAGVGLVALGSFFSSKSKSIGGQIGSSGSSGSSRASSTGSGFSAPRASTSSGGGFGNGTVVFEIAGTKLIGVLSNTLDRNRNLGGTLSIST